MKCIFRADTWQAVGLIITVSMFVLREVNFNDYEIIEARQSLTFINICCHCREAGGGSHAEED